MTLEELADYLRVTKKTVYRLLDKRTIPATRVGRQWRFDKSQIDSWLRENAQSRPVNILVIDDDAATCSLFEDTLTEHNVTSANNASSALELMEENTYDIVFLDLVMPEMDGAELLKKIRETKPNLPVTIITGHKDSELMMQALKYGPLGVMSKPFDSNDITKVVNNYLHFNITK